MTVEFNGTGEFKLAYEVSRCDVVDCSKLSDKYFSYAGARVPIVEKNTGRRGLIADKGYLTFEPRLNFDCTYNRSDARWSFTGGIGTTVEGYIQTPPYYALIAGVVPVYVRLGAGLEADADLDILSLTNLSLDLHGEFLIGPYLKVIGGVGAADVASLELYGKGELEWTLQMPETPLTKDLLFIIEVWGKAVFLCFKYEEKFWDEEWDLYGGMSQAAYLSLSSMNPKSFELLPRNYLKKSPYAKFHKTHVKKGTMQLLQATLGGNEVMLQENVYPYSEPVIVSQDGATYLFWLYDDPARGSADRTKLVFSKKTAEGWSQPAAVHDDGTADFHPNAVILPNGKILITWENNNAVFGNSAELTEMLPAVEIATALYDPATGNWQSLGNITNNAYFDHSPKLSLGNNGQVLMAWIENAANKLIGDTDGPDTFRYALWDGGQWNGMASLHAGISGMLKYSIAYNGITGYLVMEKDTDGDISTSADTELYYSQLDNDAWGQLTALTQDLLPDKNPKIVFDEYGELILVWLKDDAIQMLKDFDFNNPVIVASNMKSMGGMGFDLITRKPGGLAVVWSDQTLTGADIYLSHWDGMNEQWGTPKQLTDDGSLERSIGGSYTANNTLQLIYDKVNVTYDAAGIPILGQTDLYLLNYEEQGDLKATSVNFNNPRAVPDEEVIISGVIINEGDRYEEDLQVAFYNGEPYMGNVIGNATYAATLAPGKTGEVTLTWKIPNTNQPLKVSMVVDPAGLKEDVNRGNNETYALLLKPNLTLVKTDMIKLNNGSCLGWVKVANDGAIDAQGFTITIKKDEQEIHTENVSGLKVGEVFEKQWILADQIYEVTVDDGNVIDEYREDDNWGHLQSTSSAVQVDSDNDAIPDTDDNCSQKPNGPDLGTCSATSDKPGITCTSDADCVEGCSSNGQCLKNQEDTDQDGVGDVCDGCPNDPNKAGPGSCGCGVPDADTDDDGIADCVDTCPNDAQNDADSDGLCGDIDNCPDVPNGENLGTCSATSDKPGITCTADADCANGCSSNGLCIKDQKDSDSDGKGDVCDNCPDNCNAQQLDADNDGMGDVCDTTPGCGGCGQPQCEQQC